MKARGRILLSALRRDETERMRNKLRRTKVTTERDLERTFKALFILHPSSSFRLHPSSLEDVSNRFNRPVGKTCRNHLSAGAAQLFISDSVGDAQRTHACQPS